MWFKLHPVGQVLGRLPLLRLIVTELQGHAMNTQTDSRSGSDKPLHLSGKPMVGPVSKEVVDRESFFSPWTNWHSWIVLLAGVSIGHVIGFSPLVFVLIGVLCLCCGWLRNS